MIKLTIWNIEDEIVLSDKAETFLALSYVLDAFIDEHKLQETNTNFIRGAGSLMSISSELAHENGSVAGRYCLEN